MQFSDTLNASGLIQACERITQLGDTGISNNPALLKSFTFRLNQALDRFVSLLLGADGTWQWDDSNYEDFPIGVTNLVSGQYDYIFASDVLGIEKVLAADPAGSWLELVPVDLHERRLASRNIWQRPGSVGIPTSYDKFGTSFCLILSLIMIRKADLKLFLPETLPSLCIPILPKSRASHPFFILIWPDRPRFLI